jgi:glutaredoxin
MYIVFGKDGCIYCKLTIQLLKDKKKPFKYSEIENSAAELAEYADIIPDNFNKVPVIINGSRQFMPGGYKELEERLRTRSRKTRRRGRTRKTDSHINEGFCSPQNKTVANTGGMGSCFDKPALLNIIQSWNANKTDTIKYKKNDTHKSLWGKINRKLKGECDTEICWGRKYMTDHKPYFKPTTPKTWNSAPREWLDTINIETVLKQYERKYTDFIFLGCVPLDFDYELSPGSCVVDELCKIDINTYFTMKKRKVGIVFNLDNHDQKGSHWVAMFANFDRNEICYFDSYGFAVPTEINTLMKRLKEQACANNSKRYRNMKLKYNSVRHQYKNSECGIYCINFIVKLLEGRTFEKHCNKKTDDDVMFKNRKVFFSPNEL